MGMLILTRRPGETVVIGMMSKSLFWVLKDAKCGLVSKHQKIQVFTAKKFIFGSKLKIIMPLLVSSY
ncbi:Uncharacterised protein [Providencia alcalifaciens]|nr:Uncharacterised protein [Providencia alcalifaciens]